MADDKLVGTYILHNQETGETYVGSGILRDREYNHFRDLKRGCHVNGTLQAAFNRNPNFEFIPVPTETREEALDFEHVLINEHWGNPALLNLSKSAYACRIEQTPETKERLRQIHTGRVISDETRRKISETKKQQGWSPNPEHLAAIVAVNTGRSVSIETRDKLRESKLGTTHTEESRLRMSESRKGRVITPEWREKLRRSTEGIPHTAEHTQKAARGHMKSVVVDGVVYESISDFAQKTGMSMATASRKAKALRGNHEDSGQEVTGV